MKIINRKKRIMVLFLVLVGALVSTKAALVGKTVEVIPSISSNDSYTNSPRTKVEMSFIGRYFDKYETADEKADLVFIGEVIKVNEPKEILISETYYPNTGETIQDKDVYTVSELRVDKVIKGNIKKGDIVEVKQEGGVYNGVEYQVKDIEFFKEGERRIFLLETYEDSSRNTPASPINPHQGSMLIKDGKTKKTNDFQFINDNTDEDILLDTIKEKIKNKNSK